MKRLVVIALLSVLLTGCVKQEDYDALVKENAKLESKVEKLEEENDELRTELEKAKSADISTVSAEITPTPEASKNLIMNPYENSETGDYIVAYIDSEEGNKVVNLLYFPPENSNETSLMYEAKCITFLAESTGYFGDYNYNFLISDSHSYCTVTYSKKNDDELVMMSCDRDGTLHRSIIDDSVGDWLLEDIKTYNDLPQTPSVIWISETLDQINEDIAPYLK